MRRDARAGPTSGAASWHSASCGPRAGTRPRRAPRASTAPQRPERSVRLAQALTVANQAGSSAGSPAPSRACSTALRVFWRSRPATTPAPPQAPPAPTRRLGRLGRLVDLAVVLWVLDERLAVHGQGREDGRRVVPRQVPARVSDDEVRAVGDRFLLHEVVERELRVAEQAVGGILFRCESESVASDWVQGERDSPCRAVRTLRCRTGSAQRRAADRPS